MCMLENTVERKKNTSSNEDTKNECEIEVEKKHSKFKFIACSLNGIDHYLCVVHFHFILFVLTLDIKH